MPLTDRQKSDPRFRTTWWTLDGAKDALINERFQCSAETYYGELNAALEHDDALTYDPLVVRRLRRLRDRRRRARLDGAVDGVRRGERMSERSDSMSRVTGWCTSEQRATSADAAAIGSHARHAPFAVAHHHGGRGGHRCRVGLLHPQAGERRRRLERRRHLADGRGDRDDGPGVDGHHGGDDRREGFLPGRGRQRLRRRWGSGQADHRPAGARLQDAEGHQHSRPARRKRRRRPCTTPPVRRRRPMPCSPSSVSPVRRSRSRRRVSWWPRRTAPERTS